VRRLGPWAVVLGLALVYPLSVIASGAPRFPSRDECVKPALEDGDIEAVFGYFDSVQEATIVRDRALAVGFQGTEIQGNACGLVQVAVGGIPTLVVGREFAEQARSVGFEVTLVQAD
jgi:tetrahydromethanopterin S-methyltransferase subunit F